MSVTANNKKKDADPDIAEAMGATGKANSYPAAFSGENISKGAGTLAEKLHTKAISPSIQEYQFHQKKNIFFYYTERNGMPH